MIAFEVVLNGEKIALAGVGDNGVLTAIVTWVSKRAEQNERIDLHVVGTESPAIHLDWIDRDLKVGDSVLVNIVEKYDVDAPQLRQEPPRPDPNMEKQFKVVD